MTTATKNTTLLDLLLSAPEAQVDAVQRAMKAVAVGDYRTAATIISYAADFTEEGDAWGDAADHVASMLRTQADHS
jgi:hypothetical protein